MGEDHLEDVVTEHVVEEEDEEEDEVVATLLLKVQHQGSFP